MIATEQQVFSDYVGVCGIIVARRTLLGQLGFTSWLQSASPSGHLLRIPGPTADHSYMGLRERTERDKLVLEVFLGFTVCI